MAQVNSSDVFPSLRTISTDAIGDLQEITSVAEIKASKVLSSDINVTAKLDGALGNDVSVALVDNFGGGSNSIDVSGNAIEVRLKDTLAAASGGTNSVLNYNSAFDITSVAIGPTTIDVTVVDNVSTSSGSNEVKINATDSDISVCLVNDITTYTNGDIHTLLTSSTTAWKASLDALVTVGSLSNGSAQASEFADTLDSGTPNVNQSATIQQVVDLINNDADASALVTASVIGGGAGNLPSTFSATNLENGADATVADLEPNSEYVMFKINDIHSLLSTETNDARKVTWGVLESYAQFVLGQSAENQPENFILTRGNPTLVIDGAGTRIRQVYSIQSFYATGDFDLEDETSV